MLKKELRDKYKAKRATLSNEERTELSQQIIKRLKVRFELDNKLVSLFLPIDRFSEVLTWPMLDDSSYTKVLPVIDGSGGLKHIKYIGKEQIKVSYWGIPEPYFGEEYQSTEIDFVIVPLLAINSEGYRVGYGKGFYDDFLAKCQPDCQFIGVSFYDDFEVIDDLHNGDIALHYLATPNNIFSF